MSLERGSGVRKATGTFYTPQPIADYLVRRTLGPLVRDAPPSAFSRFESWIPRWAAARFSWPRADISPAPTKHALVRSGGCHASDIGEHERAAIRRTDCRALSVRRRRQPDGRPAGAAVAVAGDAGRRLAADLSRPSSPDRRQPARRVAGDSARARRCVRARARAARRRDAAALRHGTRPERAQGRAPGPVLARVDSERHARARSSERAGARAAEPARDRLVAVEAGRRSLVRVLALAGRRPGASRRVRRAVGRHPHRARARCRQTSPAATSRPRTRSRAPGACSTGSSSSPRRSSTPTAAASRTPASTPSSATRRGT